MDQLYLKLRGLIIDFFFPLQLNDGGDGGGIVLGSAPWAKTTLELAEKVVAEFNGSLEIFAFKVSKDSGIIRVRVDKLSDKYVIYVFFQIFSLILNCIGVPVCDTGTTAQGFVSTEFLENEFSNRVSFLHVYVRINPCVYILWLLHICCSYLWIEAFLRIWKILLKQLNFVEGMVLQQWMRFSNSPHHIQSSWTKQEKKKPSLTIWLWR